MKLIKTLFYTVVCFFLNSVYAEQISFSKQSVGELHQFNYQWKDHQGTIQQIQFELPTKTLLSKFRNFKTYQPKMAEQWVTKSLQKYVRNNPVKGVTVAFGNYLSGDTIKFTGSDPVDIDKAAKALEAEKSQLYKRYLDSIYYHSFTTPNNQLAVKPNHRRIAYESIDDLKPLKPIILESASIKNIRKVSNYVLGFIQSIPYAELTSRTTSSGAGYNPPLKLLWENQGDCDSKVTLSAALLRSLMPRIKIAMIYIDRHALLGIDIPPMGDELSITHNGTTYLLAEPTGPAIMRLGETAYNSQQAILSGHYTVEEFHVITDSINNETLEN
jgi:hypothetical protein